MSLTLSRKTLLLRNSTAPKHQNPLVFSISKKKLLTPQKSNNLCQISGTDNLKTTNQLTQPGTLTKLTQKL